MTTENNVTQENPNSQTTQTAFNKEIASPGIYYPFKLLPKFKLEVYADACLAVALNHSEKVQQTFQEIIQLWGSPGGQALIREVNSRKTDLRTWFRKRNESLVTNQKLSVAFQNMPQNITSEVFNKFIDAELDSFTNILAAMQYLVIIGFNRLKDLEKKKPKILPRLTFEDGNLRVYIERPYYLLEAIFERSLFCYLLLRPELREPKLFSDTEMSEYLWFINTTWSNRHTTRLSRKIASTLKGNGFNLQNPDTIIDGAEMWYWARVLCSTSREAADHYRIDPIDLSKRIEIYDDATGYSRL